MTVNEADTAPIIEGPSVILLNPAHDGVCASYETVGGEETISYGVNAHGMDDVDYPEAFDFDGEDLSINIGVLTAGNSPYTVALSATDSDDDTEADTGSKTVTVYVLSFESISVSLGSEQSLEPPLSGGGDAAFTFEFAEDPDRPEWVSLGDGNTLIVNLEGAGVELVGEHTVLIEISVEGGNSITCPISIMVEPA